MVHFAKGVWVRGMIEVIEIGFEDVEKKGNSSQLQIRYGLLR